MARKRGEERRADAGTKWVTSIASRVREPRCPSCSAGVFRASPV